MAALALTAGAALVPAVLAAAPVQGRPVAIIGGEADGAGRMAAVGEAGGTIMGMVGSRVLVAVSPDADFVNRLHDRGYWLVLDAQAVPGCGSRPNRI